MKHHHKWIIVLACAVAVAIILYATRLGTDDEITQRVVEALQNHPVVNANDVQISFAQGIVTMTGSFPDRESQRIAIEEAEKIRGVERVEDQTVITREEEDHTPAHKDGSPDPADQGQ